MTRGASTSSYLPVVLLRGRVVKTVSTVINQEPLPTPERERVETICKINKSSGLSESWSFLCPEFPSL